MGSVYVVGCDVAGVRVHDVLGVGGCGKEWVWVGMARSG